MHAGSLESTKDAEELHEAIAECNSSFLSGFLAGHYGFLRRPGSSCFCE